MKATLVLAPPASEPDAGLNVSHGCVLDADQLRAVLVAPVFCTARDCDEVAALPWAAEKLNVVEVVTERTAWIVTVPFDEYAELFPATSVASTRKYHVPLDKGDGCVKELELDVEDATPDEKLKSCDHSTV